MKRNMYLILPNIRSCHNVGSMFRTADGFGVSKIFLAGYTAEPPKPQIDKVSLGAEKWVPWQKVEDLGLLIADLKEKGVKVIGLEKTKESVYIQKSKIKNQKSDIALMLGNEVDGIDDETLVLCDEVVHIPMYGKKESLNVSVACGIALYELSRK